LNQNDQGAGGAGLRVPKDLSALEITAPPNPAIQAPPSKHRKIEIAESRAFLPCFYVPNDFNLFPNVVPCGTTNPTSLGCLDAVALLIRSEVATHRLASEKPNIQQKSRFPSA
jgi:hypothetical protein